MTAKLSHFPALFLLFIGLNVFAQPGASTFPVNGVDDYRSGHYAFTNAVLHVDHSRTIEGATLVIRDGKVVNFGGGLAAPKGAVLIDLDGKHIYPSFIEAVSDVGMPASKEDMDWDRDPQFVSNKKGAYGWNQAVKPEFSATREFKIRKNTQKEMKEFRQSGFGAVLSHHDDGIVRGSGVLVALGNGRENELILRSEASAHYSFDKGTSTQDYPGSLMGAIALLKQTFYDAQWYAEIGHRNEHNLSLESLNEIRKLPAFFDAGNRLDILRADKLGDRFNLDFILLGGGDEYQRIDAIRATGARLIIPVDFPKPYDVEDPFAARLIELAEMKHWEMAPANAAMLQQAGLSFCFTTHGLENTGDFLKNIRKAVQYGLRKSDALRALTTVPAGLIGASDQLGSLDKGKIANFLIVDGDIFAKGKLLENWVQGQRFVIKQRDSDNYLGQWKLAFADNRADIHISGKAFAPEVNYVVNDTTKKDLNWSKDDRNVSFHFTFPADSSDTYRFSGMWMNEDGLFKGKGQDANGEWFDWTLTFDSELDESEDKEKDKDKDKKKKPEWSKDIPYPFNAYGYLEAPTKDDYLLKDATVWTNTDKGNLFGYDVRVRNGKVSQVAENIAPASGEVVIDAKGKHLTTGIIDEHSHIAISRGVNEWTQSSSAEVCICDVINSEDVNIYRQLAGGVTGAQLLHGSANPIGGRSGLIKFRWGKTPEEMKFENSPKFIKFALGENVKQANWGDRNTTRYPQTRMGVEQTYYNYFTKAREYEKVRNSGQPYRIDLEMETLLEILNKERFITCHSYQQGEINMLMHVADSFDFTLNTFTHILEGYKVADKMKAHGANASTFSDWWAYKYEVIDAIPHNAAILNEVGVNVGINSDDAEMGRRLNQEAAKGVKYGGMSETDAWKMVTLNPAKMLHLDNRIGTIESGKDADLVIWSDHPLSIYARAEKTFVDGIKYYDMEDDLAKREYIKTERARLIAKMMDAKNGGEETQKAKPKGRRGYSCGVDGADCIH